MLNNDTLNARRTIGVFASRAAKITRLCDQARCECQGLRLKCSTCPRRLPQNVCIFIEIINIKSNKSLFSILILANGRNFSIIMGQFRNE